MTLRIGKLRLSASWGKPVPEVVVRSGGSFTIDADQLARKIKSEIARGRGVI